MGSDAFYPEERPVREQDVEAFWIRRAAAAAWPRPFALYRRRRAGLSLHRRPSEHEPPRNAAPLPILADHPMGAANAWFAPGRPGIDRGLKQHDPGSLKLPHFRCQRAPPGPTYSRQRAHARCP
jgi:hypothetical protein